MDAFLHQVVAGLATGGIYASLALALVMIHNATRLVNFAQGEMAMFATYLCWTMIQAGWPYWIAFAATLVLSLCASKPMKNLIPSSMARLLNAAAGPSSRMWLGTLRCATHDSGDEPIAA